MVKLKDFNEADILDNDGKVVGKALTYKGHPIALNNEINRVLVSLAQRVAALEQQLNKDTQPKKAKSKR